MANTQGIRAGRAFVEIGAVDATATVLRQISMRINRWASSMIASGQKMVRQALVAFVPIALSTQVFASFDDAMRRVEARSSGTASEMANLRDQAKELGRTTSSTARDIANLQAKLAQKGFRRSEIFEITPHVRNLAQGAGEGTEQDAVIAADLVSGTLRAFEMDASQSARVSDLFTFAVNNSNFSLQSLMDGMAKAAPLAADYNLSLEETIATLASMTNLNISASEAGTAFTSFLARMSKSEFTESFNKGLAELTGQTIKFRDASKNLRPPLEILDEISRATQRLGTAEKGDLLSILFGVKQFSKASGGARGASSALEFLQQLMHGSADAAEKTAKKMDAGLGGMFRRIMSAAEGVSIALGESLEGALTSLEDTVTGNLGAWTEWLQNNKQVVVGVVLGISAFLAYGVALIGFGVVLKMIAATVGFLATALTLLTLPVKLLLGLVTLFANPWLLAGAAIAALIGWVLKATGALSGLGSFFSAMGETIKGTWNGVTEALAAGDMQAAWQIAVNGLKTVWAQFVDGIMDGWTKFKDFFFESFGGFAKKIGTWWINLQRDLASGMLVITGNANEDTIGEVNRVNDQRIRDLNAATGEEALKKFREKTAKENEAREANIAALQKEQEAILKAVREKARMQREENEKNAGTGPSLEEIMKQVQGGAGAIAAPEFAANQQSRLTSAFELGNRDALEAFQRALQGDGSTGEKLVANTAKAADSLESIDQRVARIQRDGDGPPPQIIGSPV